MGALQLLITQALVVSGTLLPGYQSAVWVWLRHIRCIEVMQAISVSSGFARFNFFHVLQ